MNNYITLDTLRYAAVYPDFGPIRSKAATERITLSGASDVTYGPGTTVEYSGTIKAPVTPRTGAWGDIDDLRATLEKREALPFIDPYGVAYTVYVMGPHGEDSISPVWDGASNEFKINVRIVLDQSGNIFVPMDTLVLQSSVEDLTLAGGEVTIVMDTLVLESEAVHTYLSRPIIMQTLELISEAHFQGVEQVIVMDTLDLTSAIPNLTVT